MVQDNDHPVRLSNTLDHDKLAEAALGLLSLTLHDRRVWKALDWDITNRLHERGWIGDPKNKTKSVVLTDEGLRMAEELFRKHFVVEDGDGPGGA